MTIYWSLFLRVSDSGWAELGSSASVLGLTHAAAISAGLAGSALCLQQQVGQPGSLYMMDVFQK